MLAAHSRDREPGGERSRRGTRGEGRVWWTADRDAREWRVRGDATEVRGERIEGSMFLSMGQHTCSAARSLRVLRPKIVTASEENDPMVEE